MGHNKLSTKTPVNSERYERISERARRRNAIEELIKELPVVVSKLIEEVINEEVKITAMKELEIGREYVKVAAVGDTGTASTNCECASKVEALQVELNAYKLNSSSS